jgi:hypothetical protein
VKPKVILIALAALGLALAAVYARRKRAAETVAGVQLGLSDGGSRDLAASDPAVAGLVASAAAVRQAFEGAA